MVSQLTSDKLRQAAINNNLGGDTRDLKSFNDDEILVLFKQYQTNDNKLLSLFKPGKICKSFSYWKLDVSRNMVAESRQKLMILVFSDKFPETIHCLCCKAKKTINDLEKNIGFKKFCQNCLKTGKFKQYVADSMSAETLAIRGKRISIAKKKFYKTPAGEEAKKRIGEANSVKMTLYLQTPAGQEQIERSKEHNSRIMKEKILNGTFTPNIRNSQTHWQSEYNGQKYRSSWEAMWAVVHPHLKYETIRVPYEFKGKTKVYIVDFEDIENRILYEVKPKEHRNSTQCLAKEHGANIWCKANNYTYVIITQDQIIQHKDKILSSSLSEQIKERFKKLCK